MNKEKVLDLAKLARIDIGNEEAESLSHEFESILGYVSEIKSAGTTSESKVDHILRNIMREDTDPHQSGLYTEKILAQAPARDGDYIKIKKIL